MLGDARDAPWISVLPRGEVDCGCVPTVGTIKWIEGGIKETKQPAGLSYGEGGVLLRSSRGMDNG